MPKIELFFSPILIGIKGSYKSWLQTRQKQGEGGLPFPVWLKNTFPLLTKPCCTRIRPLAQYCFIFMYGTIVTLGLLANVAVLVAFASKKVPFLVAIIYLTRKNSVLSWKVMSFWRSKVAELQRHCRRGFKGCTTNSDALKKEKGILIVPNELE